MADWIKLSTAMFDNPKIQMLGTLPKGDSYIAFWIRLLCLAGKVNDGGCVYVAKNVAYTPQLLSTMAGKPPAFIKQTLSEFQKLGMIEIDANGVIYLIGWEKYQNTDALERIREQTKERVRRYREKRSNVNSNSSSNANVTLQVTQNSVTVTQENKNKSKSKDNYDDDNNPISLNSLQEETNSKAIQSKANNSSTVVVDSKANSNVFDLYSNNICPITPILAEKLQALVDEVGEAAVKYGIEAAVEQGKRTLPYVQACARNHLASGGKMGGQRPRGKPKVNDVEGTIAQISKEIDEGKDDWW